MAWWSCGLIIQSDKVLSTLMSNLVFKQSVWSNAMSIPLARMWGLATVWHVWIAGPQHRHWVLTDALCANAWYLPTCLAIVMANWINNAAKSLKRACFQLCRFSLPIYSLQPGRTNSSLYCPEIQEADRKVQCIKSQQSQSKLWNSKLWQTIYMKLWAELLYFFSTHSAICWHRQ